MGKGDLGDMKGWVAALTVISAIVIFGLVTLANYEHERSLRLKQGTKVPNHFGAAGGPPGLSPSVSNSQTPSHKVQSSQHQLANKAMPHAKANPLPKGGTTQKKFTVPGYGPRHMGWGYIVAGHDLSGDAGLKFTQFVNNRKELGDKCEKECEQNSLCVAYTYHPSQGACFLKSAIDGVGGADCGEADACWFWGEVKRS